MLTITWRYRDGRPYATQWFCDDCEARELASRSVSFADGVHTQTVRLGRHSTEELRHSDGELPPWCDGCDEATS